MLQPLINVLGSLGLPEPPTPPPMGLSLLFYVFIGFAVVGALALVFKRKWYLIGATIGTTIGFFAGILTHSPVSFGLGMIGAFFGFLVPTTTAAILELCFWVRRTMLKKPQQTTEAKG